MPSSSKLDRADGARLGVFRRRVSTPVPGRHPSWMRWQKKSLGLCHCKVSNVWLPSLLWLEDSAKAGAFRIPPQGATTRRPWLPSARRHGRGLPRLQLARAASMVSVIFSKNISETQKAAKCKKLPLERRRAQDRLLGASASTLASAMGVHQKSISCRVIACAEFLHLNSIPS